MSEEAKQTAKTNSETDAPTEEAPKQTNPLVESIMTSAVFSVEMNMTVKESIELLVKNRISGAPVVDNNHRVVSVVSEGDLLKLVVGGHLQKKIAGCLEMLVKPDKLVTVRKHETFLDIYKRFLQFPVHRIIVTDDNGNLQGIVSRSNILRLFAAGEPTPKEDAPAQQRKTAS